MCAPHPQALTLPGARGGWPGVPGPGEEAAAGASVPRFAFPPQQHHPCWGTAVSHRVYL